MEHVEFTTVGPLSWDGWAGSRDCTYLPCCRLDSVSRIFDSLWSWGAVGHPLVLRVFGLGCRWPPVRSRPRICHLIWCQRRGDGGAPGPKWWHSCSVSRFCLCTADASHSWSIVETLDDFKARRPSPSSPKHARLSPTTSRSC